MGKLLASSRRTATAAVISSAARNLSRTRHSSRNETARLPWCVWIRVAAEFGTGNLGAKRANIAKEISEL